MGVGMATGDNRVVQAVKKAISSPLLETSIEGAKGVILNVKGGNDLTLGQVYEAANLINSVIDSSATVIFGANIDPEYNEKFEITVIATGFTDKDEMPEEKKDEQRDNFKNYAEGLRRQRRGVRLTGDRQNSESRRKDRREAARRLYLRRAPDARHLLRGNERRQAAAPEPRHHAQPLYRRAEQGQNRSRDLGQSRGDLRRAQEIRHRPCRARPQQGA